MVMMSRTRGTFFRCTGSAVNKAAAIAGNAAFFAPLICTVPASGLPPEILNRSMFQALFPRPVRPRVTADSIAKRTLPPALASRTFVSARSSLVFAITNATRRSSPA